MEGPVGSGGCSRGPAPVETTHVIAFVDLLKDPYEIRKKSIEGGRPDLDARGENSHVNFEKPRASPGDLIRLVLQPGDV